MSKLFNTDPNKSFTVTKFADEYSTLEANKKLNNPDNLPYLVGLGVLDNYMRKNNLRLEKLNISGLYNVFDMNDTYYLDDEYHHLNLIAQIIIRKAINDYSNLLSTECRTPKREIPYIEQHIKDLTDLRTFIIRLQDPKNN